MLRRFLLGLIVGLYFVPAGWRADEPRLKKLWFDSDGVKIHYVVQGKEDGEPVLLIHGFTVAIETQWEPVIKSLSRDYRLIALDCRPTWRCWATSKRIGGRLSSVMTCGAAGRVCVF